MTLPAFTAEAALLTKSGPYRLSGVRGAAKLNRVYAALFPCPAGGKECDDCHCTVQCYGKGISRYCELMCRETCYLMFDPHNPEAGCARYRRPCNPFS